MGILTPKEKSELFAKLDEIGETKVQENLAQKIYGSSKIALVNEWLRKQEEKLNQEKSDLESLFKQQELSKAEEANRLAREAITVSREQASAAARSARWAKIAAIIAVIAAIIGPIITAYLTKK